MRITRVLLIGLAVSLSSAGVFANDLEREQLTLMLEQLRNVDTLATQARAIASVESTKRFRFDYSQLQKDLNTIREGINAYLTPARAQPRTFEEFVGEYTRDTSHQHGR